MFSHSLLAVNMTKVKQWMLFVFEVKLLFFYRFGRIFLLIVLLCFNVIGQVDIKKIKFQQKTKILMEISVSFHSIRFSNLRNWMRSQVLLEPTTAKPPSTCPVSSIRSFTCNVFVVAKWESNRGYSPFLQIAKTIENLFL